MFEPLFPIINSRGQEHDHHFDDNPEDLIFAAPPKQPNQKPTFWEWVVPAALRDIEVPVVRKTPALYVSPSGSIEMPSSCSIESDTSVDEADDESSNRTDCLTTIDEDDNENDDEASFLSENSLAYSIPKSHQLPPPEYFDIYSLPRAPSMNDEYDVDWDYLSKGMHNLPRPPSFIYNY